MSSTVKFHSSPHNDTAKTRIIIMWDNTLLAGSTKIRTIHRPVAQSRTRIKARTCERNTNFAGQFSDEK
jgi:hypothetical protein